VLANESATARPIASLSRAVALARDWAQLIATGKVQSMADLVQYSGHTKQHVRRILHCAVLSPRVIDALLDGRHPVGVTVAMLTKGLAVDWNEQCLDEGY
jgi:site-specific DNA recombinase